MTVPPNDFSADGFPKAARWEERRQTYSEEVNGVDSDQRCGGTGGSPSSQASKSCSHASTATRRVAGT